MKERNRVAWDEFGLLALGVALGLLGLAGILVPLGQTAAAGRATNLGGVPAGFVVLAPGVGLLWLAIRLHRRRCPGAPLTCRFKVLYGGVLVLTGFFGLCACLARLECDRPPPAVSPGLLRGVSLDGARREKGDYRGGRAILRLPGGAILIEADLDIDADGSPRALEIDPEFGRLQTSLSFPAGGDEREYVDAEQVPYVVLPRGFAGRYGIALGDVAAVLWRGRVAFAVYADTGPADRIGEGSVRLAQDLGHEPFVTDAAGRRVAARGIPGEVVYIVFPGSRPEGLTAANLREETARRARELFRALGGRTE